MIYIGHHQSHVRGINRTGKTPYVKRTGKTLDLEYLKPYGHIGFMHVPKEKRSKNDVRGIKVRLLGYSGNGYYLEDSEGNYHYSRDVRWLQETTSLKLKKEFIQSDDDTDNEKQQALDVR